MSKKNNNKLILGVSLLIETFIFLAVFATIVIKRKSIIRTVITVALLGGAAGTLLTIQAIKKKNNYKSMRQAVDDLCEKPVKKVKEDIDIVVDDTATESDFE